MMKAVLVKTLCVSGEFLAPETTVDLDDADFARLEEMGVVRVATKTDILLASVEEPEKPKRRSAKAPTVTQGSESDPL